MSEAANIFRVTQPREYQRRFLEAGIRLDGRGLDEFRDALLSIGSMSTADGSALVAVGETKVICGIKAEVASPKSDKPGSGYIVPNVDLPSLASSEFKSGPPSELAQTATQFMHEVLLRSQCIQLENLCIAEGKMCWVLYCDLICLNYDGNLLDACTLALVSALCNVKLPAASVNEETGLIEVDFNERIPLEIITWPVATTCSVFEKETMYVDPTSEEERQASLSITIVTTNKLEKTVNSQETNVCMIHKTGGGSLSETQLLKCLSDARKHTPAVLFLIQSTLSSSTKAD